MGLSDPAALGVILVLDRGGVSALVPVDERARARLRALRARSTDIVVSSAVLAEGLLTGHPGRDHRVARFLAIVEIADVDEPLGLGAGRLRTRALGDGASPAPSGVDALVVAEADRRAATEEVLIVTSDEDDLSALAGFGHHVDRISILGV